MTSDGDSTGDGGTSTTTAADTVVQTCKLLVLPAEIRNSIYELVFESPKRPLTNLLTATPPSSALLNVCMQLREATGLFASTQNRYLCGTTFYCTPYKSSMPLLPSTPSLLMTDNLLSRVRHLRFYVVGSWLRNLREPRVSSAAERMLQPCPAGIMFGFERSPTGKWLCVAMAGKESQPGRAHLTLRVDAERQTIVVGRYKKALVSKQLEHSEEFKAITVVELEVLLGRKLC
ncbi:hypothetical protein LTR56_021528 [Elasticomyces elasticus]|nr:hypothetical protein LTR56_021528 [Elasticomyces elasticus]KAK3631267.1 hypothetical protein LTR22_021151 [Elasticomyces elasticus]KAK4909352.1 hypothetical protein LTR49_021864 [Elasticomyces elasticus]KAK5749380.1 hypothetical protein LTS12_020561 [Elasticomyces elasticus]